MITVILLVLLLWLAQLFLQEVTLYRFDMRAITGNRDRRPQPGLIAARLGRAKDNLLESLPVFLALAVLAVALHSADGMALRGAWLFLLARTAYVPAYASGIPLLRSLLWLASMAGLALMAAAILPPL